MNALEHHHSKHKSYISSDDYDYIPPTLIKKVRREVLEEYSEPSHFSFDVAPAGKKQRKGLIARIKEPYFWEDFGFNVMHNVLVPLSALFLFGLYIYAEVVRSTGY